MDCFRDKEKRLAFIAEWYQEEAAMVRTFTVYYYPRDNAIEVHEIRNKKLFLRRTVMPQLVDGDFFVGSKIAVFGRQFDIVGYADEATKRNLNKYRQRTFILLKSCMIPELGRILSVLIESGFQINRALMVQLTGPQVKDFMGDRNKGNVQTTVLMNELITNPCIGLEIISDHAIRKILYCQTRLPEYDLKRKPKPLLELFEKTEFRRGIYCAKNEVEVSHDVAFFFDPKEGLRCYPILKNSTLCIIKPHVMKEDNLGKLVTEITSNGFKITSLVMHLMERVNCEEFLSVYNTVVPEYIHMVAQLASGVSMALEIVCTDPSKDSYAEFRKFCGPKDPEIAKQLRPNTLRAKFGVNRVMNAVHCTDLPEDTTLELQYIFKIVRTEVPANLYHKN